MAPPPRTAKFTLGSLPELSGGLSPRPRPLRVTWGAVHAHSVHLISSSLHLQETIFNALQRSGNYKQC